MSSLSIQMLAIETNSSCERAKTSHALAMPATPARPQDEVAEPLRYGKDTTYVVSPPSTLERTECELTKNFHSEMEFMLKNDAEKSVTIPDQEPIFLGTEMARSFAAMEHEYKMETWKMYLRIQSSRRSSPIGETSQGCDNNGPIHATRDVSRHDELDSETIFELELDS
jgi:hypothetical protein